MAATIFFLGIAAFKPFEAEEAILYWNRLRVGGMSTCSSDHELFITAGVNVVGSVTLHLGQLISTYRINSVDRLFPWAVYDFKISPAERQEILYGRQPLCPNTGLVGVNHLGKASTLRYNAEERLGSIDG